MYNNKTFIEFSDKLYLIKTNIKIILVRVNDILV